MGDALFDGEAEASDGQGIFVADVENSFASADGAGGNGHAFDDAIGEGFEQHAIHEGPGVAFVAVADDDGGSGGSGEGVPFSAGGEACAATSAKSAVCDDCAELCGGELEQAAVEGAEAAGFAVGVDVERGELAAVLGGDAFLFEPVGGVDAEPEVGGVTGDGVVGFGGDPLGELLEQARSQSPGDSTHLAGFEKQVPQEIRGVSEPMGVWTLR